MKDLKCGKKNCKHNRGYSCCAKKIEVANNTDCLSFAPIDKRDFEAAADFGRANYSVDTAVGCHADCIFQKDNVCIANGITVMGDHNCAICQTYVKA